MCGIRLIPDTVGAVCRQGYCVSTNWCRFISCLFRPRRRELSEYYSTSDCAPEATRCIINLKLHCARERELVRHAERPWGRGCEAYAYTYGGAMVWRWYGENTAGATLRSYRFRTWRGGIVPRTVLRSMLALSSLAPTIPTQARLLWLMHFAWVLDPICMHHARKSGTKLNCRYIVPQDVGPDDTNKSPWKSRRRNRRTFAERLNSLESARVLVFFSLSFMHFIRLPLFSDFSAVRIRVRGKNRSALSSSVHSDSCIIFLSSYGFDKSDVSAL